MSKVRRALGLMSGTSMDGIDIALIETDGSTHVRRLASLSVPYPPEFQASLRQTLGEAAGIRERSDRPGILAAVERELTDRHGEALLKFIGDRMLQPNAIDVIGFHGQTVLHRPGARLTVQLGDGVRLAELTGIDVVYDLRAADVAAGGQGAPLVPVYHRALAQKVGDRPIAFLNIGGVANVTWIGRDESLVAFDTGPGNALIDDWMLLHTGIARDAAGAAAASGKVDEDALSTFLTHDYFGAGVPKSLDRNTFSSHPVDNLSVEDGAATLTAFTAAAIARSRAHMPAEPQLWVVCGGGRRNRTLMQMIAERVECAVVPAEALDLDGDTLEAEAWAYLAVRSIDRLPITYPRTTGVSKPMSGGVLIRAPNV